MRSQDKSDLLEEYSDDDSYSASSRAAGGGSGQIKRLVMALLGRWYWIVLCMLIGWGWAVYALDKTPNRYTATTTLLMKVQVDQVLSRDQIADIPLESMEAMNTTMAQISSLDMLERVAARQDVRELPGLVPLPVDWRPEWLQEKMGVEPPVAGPPPQAANLAKMIRGWLSLSVRPVTRLLDIRIDHPTPEVAKAVADAIASEYLAELRSDAAMNRSWVIELLSEEAEDARELLEEATGSLVTYNQALESKTSLDAHEAIVAQLEQTYLPAHPKMMGALAELKRLQDHFIKDFEIARKAPSEAAYWEEKADFLPNFEQDPEGYLRTGRALLMSRVGILNKEISNRTSLYSGMLKRIEESRVNGEGGELSAEIENLARTPVFPSSPVPKSFYTKGLGGGFAAGLAIAFVLVRLDSKFQTVAQLEGTTGIATLAAISDINVAHLAKAEKLYYSKHPDDSPEPYIDWDPHLVFRPGTSSTSYAEMYRVLRASVSLLGDETKRKITMFSSALPGEGKTSTSVNFALAAAGQRKKTLLIDLDLRKPSIHKAFGIPRIPESGGISDCLAGDAHINDVIIRDCPEKNLHIVVSGKRVGQPGELLNRDKLKMILAWAVENYDIVVLDTAPLLAVPDSRVIAPLVDNFCLIVRANYVPKGAVRRVLEVLEDDESKLDGIVFNGFVETRRAIGENYSYGYYKTSRYGRSYQYGYGSYGSYGAYGADDEDEAESAKALEKRRKRRRKQMKV
ncbi:polysaccharide biosynthesis tyrosine autokinase [Haloferula chungangensis]|uniref:Polysaccharide biosynthesis tyrosine autokinase n=1 Tax=Haloferula chungangensis TaxID=1048331 RepID=A0ABW2L9W9_9BACT